MRSPRNLSKDSYSPNGQKVGDIDNSMSDEEKTKERFESKKEEANLTLGDMSLMKNSPSGGNLNNTLTNTAGKKSPNRQSPSRTSKLSPRYVYNTSSNKLPNNVSLNTSYK